MAGYWLAVALFIVGKRFQRTGRLFVTILAGIFIHVQTLMLCSMSGMHHSWHGGGLPEFILIVSFVMYVMISIAYINRARPELTQPGEIVTE